MQNTVQVKYRFFTLKQVATGLTEDKSIVTYVLEKGREKDARLAMDVSLRYKGTAGHCDRNKIKGKLSVNKQREFHAFSTYKILVNKIS
jgi:hypothetical protein